MLNMIIDSYDKCIRSDHKRRSFALLDKKTLTPKKLKKKRAPKKRFPKPQTKTTTSLQKMNYPN